MTFCNKPVLESKKVQDMVINEMEEKDEVKRSFCDDDNEEVNDITNTSNNNHVRKDLQNNLKKFGYGYDRNSW